MANSNPEQLLIDVIVDQIEDDEGLIDGLGSGTLSLRDVERWRERRWESERGFMRETGRLIGRMREEGFDHEMRSGARPAASRARAHPAEKRPSRRVTPAEQAERLVRPLRRRFSLELADLGLPCSLYIEGDYDDVLELGAWHARHAHHLHGGADSVRETLESSIVEVQSTRLAPETRFHGRRPEEVVSNEWANRTRGSGLPG